MAFRRRDGTVIHAMYLGLVLLLGFVPYSHVMAQDQCTLCADGSDPDMSLTSPDLGWSCTDLNTYASILKPGDSECTDLQKIGFQDCGCPTYPPGFCTLCPAGFSDIPDKTVPVPSTQNLTCGDILFVHASLLENGCEDLAPYRERCGCPTDVECSFCADGTMPTNMDRILPYLSRPGETTTCAQQASYAFSAPAALCDDIIVAPVPVNAQALCGCQGTFPSNLCTLCPTGMEVVNPNLVLPETGGLTCLDMEEYLRYITDETSCQTIADRSQICCQPVEPCPVCQGTLFNQDKVYEPYGLTCDNIGLASQFGYPMTCDDVQTRFPFFCECAAATPACTLCQLGELPPELDKDIPLLGTTCKEVNDYASIRLTSECAQEMASMSFDASAYCGCTGFDPPRQCAFCPEGQIVRDTGKLPLLASGATCGELYDFANYVTTFSLCSSLQAFGLECCVDPDSPTEAPSVGPPVAPTTPPAPTTSTPSLPTAAPTRAPTPEPTSSGNMAVVLVPSLVMLMTSILAPLFLS